MEIDPSDPNCANHPCFGETNMIGVADPSFGYWYMCWVLDRVPSEISFLTYNCIQFGISQERNSELHTIIYEERDLVRNAI